jgi:pimeloyl-ACP methyl ester carboxylesterase
MRFTVAVALLLALLTACVPVVAPDPPTASIAGGTFAAAPFDAYASGYEVMGRGPSVVMIHGIGGGSSMFQYRLNAPVLAAAGYRVYTLDLLGFGRSSRPEIRYTQDLMVAQITDFLETVVGESAVVVANGLAGAYAIRVAAERPDLISALALIGPTGYEQLNREQNDARTRFFDLLANPIVGEAFASLLVETGAQRFFLLDAYHRRESLTPEVLATYDRNLKAPGARWVVFSFVSGNLDQDVRTLWPRTTAPTLLVWGLEEGFNSLADAEDFLRARPESSFLLLRDASLLPNEERADAFNEALLGFLRRIGI